MAAEWFGAMCAVRQAGYYVDETPYEIAGDVPTQGASGEGRGGPRLGRERVERHRRVMASDCA